MNLLNFTSGKKTYLTVALGIAFGLAQALGIHVPDWLIWMTGFSALGFHRSALSDEAATATAAVKTLALDALTQLEQPVPPTVKP